MSGRDDTGEQVILATAGYDHSIRFWQAHNGVCHRTVPHTDSISFSIWNCTITESNEGLRYIYDDYIYLSTFLWSLV